MKQSTSRLIMVRPKAFQYNVQTAQSNDFQNEISSLSKNQVLKTAQMEFDTMVDELVAENIEVEVIEDTENPIKPDAIFPNNWLSMSQEGVLTIFPMKNENRQYEKRKDIIERIENTCQVTKKIDLSEYEEQDRALEGTGSIVFDHINRRAYACLSPRTDEEILRNYCKQIDYTPVVFKSMDNKGKLIYHTNVVMCIGSGYVVMGLDSVKNEVEKSKLIESFETTHLELIQITEEQLLHHFAGNMLQVENDKGDIYLVMSKRAYTSLSIIQISQIEKYAKILPVSIDIIETIGGGSARCMIAENFLEER